MKISVVIPVYNEEKYIDNCLKALFNQQQPADEIIIVDNNCTDNTINIAKKYRVKIIKESKRGTAFAQKTGYDFATGDIIARTDADTIVPSDWIITIKKNFSTGQIDALTGPMIFYDLLFPITLFIQIYFFIFKIIQKGKETLIGPNMIITRNIWRKVKDKVCLTNNLVHEDSDLAIHINNAGGVIKKDNNLIVKASARRIKNNPLSFFIGYPLKAIRTFKKHKL